MRKGERVEYLHDQSIFPFFFCHLVEGSFSCVIPIPCVFENDERSCHSKNEGFAQKIGAHLHGPIVDQQRELLVIKCLLRCRDPLLVKSTILPSIVQGSDGLYFVAKKLHLELHLSFV